MQVIRDENRTTGISGTLQSDGVTQVAIKVNPANGNSVKVLDDTTGTASTLTQAIRDENRVPVWMGVSSSDMTTLVPIAVDINGNLLIQST